MMELTYEMLNSNGRLLARVSATYSAEKPPHIDRVSLDSERSRKRFASVVAEKSGTPSDEIENELLKIAAQQADQPAIAPSESEDKQIELTRQQREEAEQFLRSPDVFDRISADIETMGIEGEREFALTVYLVLTSRLLKHPLQAIAQGPTGSGKSFVEEGVASLFPPEALFRATSLSDKAWYYLPEGAVRHKAVTLGEREQSNDPARIDARRAWRELVVSGEASRVVTIIDPVTREPKTVKKTVRGPCAFIETTTSESVLEEDASRMLPLRPCERQEQTRRIIDRLARDATNESDNERERKATAARHHAVQRLLGEYTGIDILIPYAPHISIPTDKIIARRVFSYVLSMTRSVALIRILQKPPERRGQADLNDYEIASALIRPLVARQLSNITDIDLDTLEQLKDSQLAEFTASMVAPVLGITERHARRRLTRLHRAELIEETQDSRRNRREFRVSGRQAATTDGSLTAPEELREAIAEREAIVLENQ